jgi:transposase
VKQSREEPAVDQVRRIAQKSHPELKRTRYIWLKNTTHLTPNQQDVLVHLSDRNLKTSRAYQIRLTFQELYAQPSREAAEALFKKWYFWATHSCLPAIVEAAKTMMRYRDGILRWLGSGEQCNSKPT